MASNTIQIIVSLKDTATKNLKNIGRSLTKFLILPLAALSIASVKAFATFESAFAGVRKTVDATEAEFKVLSDAIRQMAKEIPASTVEISRVAEAAGQLGIQKENILAFTRTMIDLGNSTNLASEQAATALARLANITGLQQDKFDELGSTIVGLGNNFATTEAEIVELGLRIAGAGKQIGLSEANILSFATALSSVGIRAEAGGSAFTRVMVEIAKASKSGGKALANFAEVAGVSTDEFQKRFETDAAGAIVQFVEGLDRISKSGGNVFTALENLGFANIRVRDTLLRASGAGQLMNDALEQGEKFWKENTALTTEAEKRYKTMVSQLKILVNRIKDLGITIGTVLAPFVIKAAGLLGDFADRASKAFVLLPQVVAIATQTIKDLLFKLFNDASFFKAFLKNAGIFAVEFLQGFGNMFIQMSIISIKMGAILFSPLAVGFQFIGEKIRANFEKLMTELVKIANTVLPKALEFDEATFITGPAKTFAQLWEENGRNVGVIMKSMGDNFANIKDGFTATFATLKGAIGDAAELSEIQAMQDKISALFEALDIEAAETGKNIVKGLTGGGEGGEGQVQISAFAEFVKSSFTDVGETMKDIWVSTRDAFGDMVAESIVEGKNFGDALKGFFKDILKAFLSMVARMLAEKVFFSLLTGGLGGGGGLLSGVGKIFGFAKGGVIPGGLNPVSAANGGVFTSPTLAVIGDNAARQEAVIPMSGGKVPVQLSGGGGQQIVIQRLEIMPNANIDEALFDKPITWWRSLVQAKILPALNAEGDDGAKTSLAFRSQRI